ncbi:hypothetical protein [Candidatus Laterigemmans baculatus]|uniref:hypothetical protein n=1 Tax=Candidatus Laterigemmans baculatus TaxID=2770505 RepID=UPI0013DB15C2|nr:hypothetical protein [Candidatus Laterigemmans baculatus]
MLWNYVGGDYVRWDDLIVGGLAIGLAAAATASAAGLMTSPYRLASVRSIQQRYGEPAARVFFVMLAALMLLTGTAILSGLRPSYSGLPRSTSDAAE